MPPPLRIEVFPLFELPPELRNLIYTAVFGMRGDSDIMTIKPTARARPCLITRRFNSDAITQYRPLSPAATGRTNHLLRQACGNAFARRTKYPILFVSRQVNEEAMSVLYGVPTFMIHITPCLDWFLDCIGPVNISRIRKLHLLVSQGDNVCHATTVLQSLKCRNIPLNQLTVSCLNPIDTWERCKRWGFFEPAKETTPQDFWSSLLLRLLQYRFDTAILELDGFSKKDIDLVSCAISGWRSTV
jgi:hypothetical protein